MSLLLIITFLLLFGYINPMSIPQLQQQQYDPDILVTYYNDDITDNKIKNNKVLLKKIIQDPINSNKDVGNSDIINDNIIDKSGITILKKRSENSNNYNNNQNSDKILEYPKKNDECDKKCLMDYKLYDDDYENLFQKYKLMDSLIASLEPKYLEVFSNSGLANSSGRREGPLYAEEPKFVVIPKELDDDILDLLYTSGSSDFKDFFIPPRGRKQMPILEKIKNHYELFVPNRGKKTTTNIKKDKIKDIFKYNDLFFPNRGKKNFKTEKE